MGIMLPSLVFSLPGTCTTWLDLVTCPLPVQVHVMREHFEYTSPYSRLPFSDSMDELAASQPQLQRTPLASVHMASWYAQPRNITTPV